MWNTWNIHRMMSESQNRVFKATIKEGWENKAYEFGDKTKSKERSIDRATKGLEAAGGCITFKYTINITAIPTDKPRE